MFNKLETLKKFSKNVISIESLVDIVKDNPQKDIISKIRDVEYKSTEYNNLKLRMSCITPHGIFSSLKNEGLTKLSGYLYYDIDGFDTEIELNDTKNRLIETNMCSFICKSVGGKGLSFLIKYKIDTINIANDTFDKVYGYVRELLIGKGFKIDRAAGGLVRKMFISNDVDVYFNNNQVSLSVNVESIKIDGFKKIKDRKKKEVLQPNDTFKLIDYDELMNQISLKTIYTNEINGDFVVDSIDYYSIHIPKIIKDGTKHKLYIRVINALYFINKSITQEQVYSYLYHINENSQSKMADWYLRKLVKNICTNIEETGEIRIKPRVKRLHFNNNMKITKNQKQSMGAQITANLKRNKTIELIENARMDCMSRNEIPTQRIISQMTGLSISTVKRNWNAEVSEVELTIPPVSNKDERDYKLNELTTVSEDLFFTKETQIINYKNFKSVEIEKPTPEDKKLFISKINDLKEAGIEPSESIMIDLKLFDEYKTWYMYDKWLKINNNHQITLDKIID